MIDFKQIRSFSGGQREAFEELVCQLGRREVVSANSVFRRVEGSGGDGGVEAYWVLPKGKKIGYQAKYFTRAGDIDWGQIDESVKQALKTHPTLVKYIIAIPCDLTDRRGLKGKGQTGWELWASHRKKWRTGRGKFVEFIPWTASELQDKLSMPSADGLRRYWFGAVEFSPDWFRDHVHLAVASLDERYHPEDHVDLGIESLFQFISRHEVARSKIRNGLAAIKDAPFPDRRLSGHIPELPPSVVDQANAALAALLELEGEFEFPSWQDWDITRWKTLVTDLKSATGKLLSWAQNARSNLADRKDEKARSDVEYILHDLIKVSDTIEAFYDIVDGRYLLAESDRVALIEGRAGTGKSHLLGRIAEGAIRDGYPVVFLLGQQFRDHPLWDQIAKQLGLGDIAADELLQSLDVAAEATRKRGLILVDAVNEGAGARLWKPEIAAFLERVKRFPNLICVVTCRSEYVPYVLPEGLLLKIQRFEIHGFVTAEEQVRAAKIYMDKRGISRPSVPWLAPEFVNPLFLRSACVALNRDGKSEFPRGLTGTKSILMFYLRSVARNLVADRAGTDELVPATIKSLLAIAAQMTANRKDYISLVEATSIAEENFSSFPAPLGQTWYDILHRNGLLRNDPNPTAVAGDALTIVEDVVRFSFQRFQDHLMAETLLESTTDISLALEHGGSIAFIHDGKKLQWQWQGLVDALSLQIPERFGVELVDALPGKADYWWRVWRLRDAFVESIRWRDKQAFSDRTLELFNLLSGGQIDQFSLLLELSASVDHPWNGDFLHRNLSKRKLSNRDAFWTARLNDLSIEGDDPVGRLIDWCLFGQVANVERATQRLCGITLCWLFTSSSRIIRDRATKALTSLFISRYDLFPEIAVFFKEVDDIYVTERLYAAAYGACCIDPFLARLESYAVVTFDLIFSGTSVPLSLLLRDYARGIVERCAVDASLPSTIEVKKCRPPYRSTKPRLNTSIAELERIAKKAGDQAILNSCTGWVGDFGKYELTPRTSSFTAVPLNQSQCLSKN